MTLKQKEIVQDSVLQLNKKNYADESYLPYFLK